MQAVRDAQDVDVENPAPVCHRLFPACLDAPQDPRVVAQQVHIAEVPKNLVSEGLDFSRDGDVHGNRVRLEASARQLLGSFADSANIAVRQDDTHPLVGKAFCHGESNARSGPGYDRDLSFQFLHQCTPRRALSAS